VLHLAGCPVTVEDAGWLVERLYQDAHPEAIKAALTIENGVDGDRFAVALTRPERRAILGVLDDPPDGLLELRGVLMREVVA